MDEKRDHDKDKGDLVKHIFDLNQGLIQMADTKIGILLAINAIIISFSATLDLNEYNMYPKIIMILAIVSSVLSSFMFFFTLLPRLSEYNDTVIFYKGILKYPQDKFVSRMTVIANDELLEDYLNSIYVLALVQNKKYLYLILGLTFLVISFLLIALSFIFQNTGLLEII
jgi:hypothetical protein